MKVQDNIDEYADEIEMEQQREDGVRMQYDEIEPELEGGAEDEEDGDWGF